MDFYRSMGVWPMVAVTSLLSCLGGGCSADTAESEETADADSALTYGVIVSDDFRYRSTGRGSALAFGPEYKWHHMNLLRPLQNGELRWFLETNTNDGFDARGVIRRAYAHWQPYVPFRFVEASSAAEANTVIRFVNGANFTDEQGVAQPFWRSPNGVILGVAWAPNEQSRNLNWDYWGDIFINDLAQWNESTTPSVTVTGRPGGGSLTFRSSLLETVTHEIGHTLGLAHDDSHARNIMHNGGNQLGTGALWDADVMTATTLYQLAYHAVFGAEHVSRVIDSVYWRVLGRAPDPGGMQHFRSLLEYHELPSRNTYDFKQFYVDLTSSEEAWNVAGRDPSNYIAWLYYWMLNRWPEDSEINAWLPAFNSMSRAQLARAFADSDEWNFTFVYGMQWSLLRSPRQPQLSELTAALRAGTMSPFQAEVAIANSPEFFGLLNPQNNTSLIDHNYRYFLGRAPDPAGLEYWLSWID
jgi:hypothetical protein